MPNKPNIELSCARSELVLRIEEARRLSRLVAPYNKDLYLVSQRALARLLLSLDLVDAKLAEISGQLITPYWIPKL